MKPLIIAGIDFSDGSMSALQYAIRVANAIDANIMMVWVDKMKNPSAVYANSFDPRLEAKKRFEEIMDDYRPKLLSGKFLFKIRNGKVHKELVNQAKYHDAVMIVAGTHGVSGFDEFWIGSNAYKIVAYATCPVLTIRYGVPTDKAFTNIVLPVDSTRETRQKLPYTAFLANQFNAKINILSLYSTGVKTIRDLVDNYSEQAMDYLKERDINCELFTLEADNLTDGTIEFAKSVDADLISIMTEQETSATNLLLGPYAQQMVNHSPIPVLTIRSRSIYDYQTR